MKYLVFSMVIMVNIDLQYFLIEYLILIKANF